ncbi:hypothetical protein [Vitreimonas flagellata]|uniref:hypothetical protein n=1 Tax=Vitreimonas flagellata TaxID=2560861 RepID=UPI001074FEBF|nr:hypothetical protein [Vitreimonas flagellata]
MSDGFRRKIAFGIIALLTICALAVIGLGAISWTEQRREHGVERDAAVSEQQQHVREPIEAQCSGAPRSRNFRCTIDAPQAPSDERYTSADLRAQQDMAAWAFATFVTGVVGALITVAGVIYVAWTLAETRKATGAAQSAADAAKDANKAFAEHSQRELRAYVGVPVVAVKDLAIGAQPTFSYQIKNFGATPARELESKYYIVACDDPNTHKVRTPADKVVPTWSSRVDLAPGQEPVEVTQTHHARWTEAMHTAFAAGQGTLMLCAIIRYRDVYGKRHWTMFKSYLRPGTIRNGAGVLSATRKHNRAN